MTAVFCCILISVLFLILYATRMEHLLKLARAEASYYHYTGHATAESLIKTRDLLVSMTAERDKFWHEAWSLRTQLRRAKRDTEYFIGYADRLAAKYDATLEARELLARIRRIDADAEAFGMIGGPIKVIGAHFPRPTMEMVVASLEHRERQIERVRTLRSA